MSVKLVYEAWEDDDGVILSSPEGINEHRKKGLFVGTPRFLHRIEASSYEEAMAIHHIKMGWEPYKPMGEPENCPKCGAIYYPKGSGMCPRCGGIL